MLGYLNKFRFAAEPQYLVGVTHTATLPTALLAHWLASLVSTRVVHVGTG
jgi:hypothetical protein